MAKGSIVSLSRRQSLDYVMILCRAQHQNRYHRIDGNFFADGSSSYFHERINLPFKVQELIHVCGAFV